MIVKSKDRKNYWIENHNAIRPTQSHPQSCKQVILFVDICTYLQNLRVIMYYNIKMTTLLTHQ